jgi:hypothetical protein
MKRNKKTKRTNAPKYRKGDRKNINTLRGTELQKELWKIISGKGVAERIAKDAAKPIVNVKNDGIVFDPRWQDDII